MQTISLYTSKTMTALSRLLGYGAVIALLFLIFSATLDVVYRYIFAKSLFYGLLEYGEVALVSLAFLSAVNTQLAGGHVSSTLVTRLMPVRLRSFVRAIALSFLAALLAWAAYASGVAAYRAFESGEVRFGLVRIPMWPVRSVVPISLGLLSGLFIRDAWRLFGSTFSNRATQAVLAGADEEHDQLSI